MEFPDGVRVFSCKPLQEESRGPVTVQPMTSRFPGGDVEISRLSAHCVGKSFDAGPELLVGGICADALRLELVGVHQFVEEHALSLIHI